MKEVPKKDEPEVSGGLQLPSDFRGGLVIPGMPAPGSPGPCIPIDDPILNNDK